MTQEFMQAVVFKEPKRVVIEERPIPHIQEPSDIIVKVKYTALCGSELHVYRGSQPSPLGFIMGHEFTGIVDQLGSDVRSVKKGDLVVAPFTISCGKCFYCIKNYSSRCEEGMLFGSPALDGAQAGYVRVPLANSSVVKAPKGIDPLKLCLMADIFPTGYSAAKNAFAGLVDLEVQDSTVVVIGCGPVGLCAIVNALHYKSKHLLAVDGLEDRLACAEKFGAEPWSYLSNLGGLSERVKELTGGRGADIVIEVVGSTPALQIGFELLRSWGNISSVGVHNGAIPWSGN